MGFTIKKLNENDVTVYDITVDTDHSFTVGDNRTIVHNCSGGYIDDSIYSFYSSQLEAAMLSKNGFGTSGYLGDIRPRGDIISTGGFASGVVPVLKDFIQLSRDVSQGSNRRGAWAGYLEIDHDDFWEVITYLEKHPDDCNIGWNISDKFIARLDDEDEDAINRYQKTLKIKMITGKGYYFFTDRVNDQNPQCYKDKNFKVLASNLCLAGDTKIKIKGTKSGYIETDIKEYIEKYSKYSEIFEIWSYNINDTISEWKTITNSAMTNPKAKLIKITDDETGKYIKCTLEHKVYTKNRGYIMAKDLIPSDELVIG